MAQLLAVLRQPGYHRLVDALPGYDAAVQAMTGIMSINGEAEGGPLRVGLPVVDMVTGLNAVIGVLLALQERQKSGRGQFVELQATAEKTAFDDDQMAQLLALARKGIGELIVLQKSAEME